MTGKSLGKPLRSVSQILTAIFSTSAADWGNPVESITTLSHSPGPKWDTRFRPETEVTCISRKRARSRNRFHRLSVRESTPGKCIRTIIAPGSGSSEPVRTPQHVKDTPKMNTTIWHFIPRGQSKVHAGVHQPNGAPKRKYLRSESTILGRR
jgi:hypothetical protein